MFSSFLWGIRSIPGSNWIFNYSSMLGIYPRVSCHLDWRIYSDHIARLASNGFFWSKGAVVQIHPGIPTDLHSSSYPTEETPSSCSYPKSHSFSHEPKPWPRVTAGTDNAAITADAAAVRRFISRSILPSLVNKILRCARCGFWASYCPEWQMEQSTILWQGTTASDMEALTHPNHFVLDLRCPGVGRESDEQGEQDKSLSALCVSSCAAAFTLIWRCSTITHTFTP